MADLTPPRDTCETCRLMAGGFDVLCGVHGPMPAPAPPRAPAACPLCGGGGKYPVTSGSVGVTVQTNGPTCARCGGTGRAPAAPEPPALPGEVWRGVVDHHSPTYPYATEQRVACVLDGGSARVYHPHERGWFATGGQEEVGIIRACALAYREVALAQSDLLAGRPGARERVDAAIAALRVLGLGPVQH